MCDDRGEVEARIASVNVWKHYSYCVSWCGWADIYKVGEIREIELMSIPYILEIDLLTLILKIHSKIFQKMANAETQAVLIDKTDDGITTITINRPRRKNAIDGPTGKRLTEAFVAFENDPNQKVCVFYGANGTFCAGFDLHELAKFDGDPNYKGPIVDANHSVQGRNIGPIGPSRMQIKKPVISAVSGYAVAGGLELSLLGDIRVAEEDAVFGVFCRRFGVPLIDGGTVRLQAIIGLGRALDMILTGRGVPAQEALQMGLANRVVPKGQALAEATKIAKQLLAFPQACMNVDRANCYYSVYNATSFEDALRNEFDHGVKVVTKESVKGAARFSGGEGRHGAFDGPHL